jgi:hypothetical protein
VLQFTSLIRWTIAVVFACLTTLGLSACSNNSSGSYSNFPSNQIISQAIARQVEQIQAPLSAQLKLPAPGLKDIRISHLKIVDKGTALINGAPGYHVSGEYDFSIKQSDGQSPVTHDQFDISLQPRQETKVIIWQLAQKIGDTWKLETLNH